MAVRSGFLMDKAKAGVGSEGPVRVGELGTPTVVEVVAEEGEGAQQEVAVVDNLAGDGSLGVVAGARAAIDVPMSAAQSACEHHERDLDDGECAEERLFDEVFERGWAHQRFLCAASLAGRWGWAKASR